MSKLRFKQIVRLEKQQMNPIRWKINYIAIPILFGWFIACLCPAITLMSIDEAKYYVPFLILLGAGLLPIGIMLGMTPVIRKKETAIECAKYDFDAPAEESDLYVWEKEIRLVSYVLEASVFAEFDGTEDIVGTAKLGERLHEMLYGKDFVADEPLEVRHDSFHFVDFTEGGAFCKYRLDVETAERTRVEVTETQKLEFSAQGMTMNGKLFPWQDVTAQVVTSNSLLLAKINVQFSVSDRTASPYAPYRTELISAQVRLDKRLIKLIEQFGVELKNRPIYDYILTHKQDAVYQILKHGTVKKIK